MMFSDYMSFTKFSPEKLFIKNDGLTYFRQMTPDQLGISANEEAPTEYGYIMCGKNPSSLIKKISPVITLELEGRMKPGNFLKTVRIGKDESIKDLLIADNDYVLDKGFTHQQLGQFLLYFNKVSLWLRDYKEYTAQYGYPDYFIYNNHVFKYKREPFKGWETDPFNFDMISKTNNTLCNVKKRSELKFTTLQALMMYRHGFYGGKTVEKNKRIEPSKIISLGF